MEEILREAKIIARGEIPKVRGVEFSDVKELEYSDEKLKELIEKARLKRKLEIEVERGVEEILEKVKKPSE